MSQRTRRFALAGATLAACLVAADWLLRTALPVGAMVYRLTPEFHQAYIPGASKIFVHRAENGGDWVRVDVNRDGFRGDALEPPGAALRIVVYGDSFIASEFAPIEESFGERLEAILEARLARPVEVVNAGVVGFGPGQVARRMETELAVLEPALVVLAVTSGNDAGDLMRNKLYRLGHDGRALRNEPEPDPRLDAHFAKRFPANSGLAQTARAAWRRLRFLLLGVADPETPHSAEHLLARARRDHRRFVDEGNDRVENLFADAWDADIALDPGARSSREKRALLEAVLVEVREIAERAEVPVQVVVLPAAVDAVPEYDALAIEARLDPDYRARALSEAAVAAARNAKLPTIDLFDDFEGRAELYYRGGDDHWSPAGQALAAERVAAELLGSGLLR